MEFAEELVNKPVWFGLVLFMVVGNREQKEQTM